MFTSLRSRLWLSYAFVIAIALGIVAIVLLVFLFLFLAAPLNILDPHLLKTFLRLDPLAMLAQLLAGRYFETGVLLALITLGITLVFGRAWCGWFCPLGTILDIFPLRGKKKNLTNLAQPIWPPENYRKFKYLVLFVLITAAILGNLNSPHPGSINHPVSFSDECNLARSKSPYPGS